MAILCWGVSSVIIIEFITLTVPAELNAHSAADWAFRSVAKLQTAIIITYSSSGGLFFKRKHSSSSRR